MQPDGCEGLRSSDMGVFGAERRRDGPNAATNACAYGSILGRNCLQRCGYGCGMVAGQKRPRQRGAGSDGCLPAARQNLCAVAGIQ